MCVVIEVMLLMTVRPVVTVLVAKCGPLSWKLLELTDLVDNRLARHLCFSGVQVRNLTLWLLYRLSTLSMMPLLAYSDNLSRMSVIGRTLLVLMIRLIAVLESFRHCIPFVVINLVTVFYALVSGMPGLIWRNRHRLTALMLSWCRDVLYVVMTHLGALPCVHLAVSIGARLFPAVTIIRLWRLLVMMHWLTTLLPARGLQVLVALSRAMLSLIVRRKAVWTLLGLVLVALHVYDTGT